jgi:hypothetical protein
MLMWLLLSLSLSAAMADETDESPAEPPEEIVEALPSEVAAEDEPSVPATDPVEEVHEELLIEEDIAVERAKAQLDRRIRDLGYREGEIKEDRVIYRPNVVWKPSVIVHDEAFVIIRRTPPRFEPWIGPGAPIRYLSCIPPFTILCVKMQGWWVSKRRLQHQKTTMSEGLDPMIRDWREAVVDRAMRVRVEDELPSLLDGVWLRGIPLDSRDPILASAASRRAEILELWASRTCTPEGEQVRDVVQTYLIWEVQRSDTPATQDEIDAANQDSSCEAQLPWPLEPTRSAP